MKNSKLLFSSIYSLTFTVKRFEIYAVYILYKSYITFYLYIIIYSIFIYYFLYDIYIYIYIYTSNYLYISIFKTKIKSLSSIAGTRIISTSKKLNKNMICCPV